MNRREFLNQSALLTASLYAGTALVSEAKTIKKLGAQLYSVRDLMPKDAKNTMKQLAAMGYTQFESYGDPDFLWGMAPKECKTFLADMGVTMVSAHFDQTKELEKSFERGAEAGLTYMLCPYLGPQKSIGEWKRKAEEFNKIGETAKKYGLKFGYHNHDYSFRDQEGQIPQEVFLDNTDPNLVVFELDICWIVAAGRDAVAHLNKYSKRYELGHLKDMVQTNGKVSQKNLGEGTVPFQAIVAAGNKNGIKHFFVEQEQYPVSSLESMKANAEWVKKFKF